MVFDFALILTIATLFTGVVWLFDVLVLRSRRAAADASANEPVLVEYCRTFFPVILVVLLVRSFLFEPFRIPSDSMMPTLLDGDFIFVNKYAYGIRLPVLNKKIVEIDKPERGDVVVFRLPANPNTNYIKRVIGLPGDRIVYSANRLYINGELMPTNMRGATGNMATRPTWWRSRLAISNMNCCCSPNDTAGKANGRFRRGIILSWATTAITAGTAGFRVSARSPNPSWSDVRSGSG